MTIDDSYVYWTEIDGQVRGVPKSGGASFDAAYVFGNPTDITVDSEHLYWVLPEFGEVAMAPKPVGEATQISGQNAPQAIAASPRTSTGSTLEPQLHEPKWAAGTRAARRPRERRSDRFGPGCPVAIAVSRRCGLLGVTKRRVQAAEERNRRRRTDRQRLQRDQSDRGVR